MKKLIALTALAATVGLTACASDRHDKGGRDGDHRQGSGKKMHGEHKQGRDGLPYGFERLNLSDAQKQQIQTILNNNRPAQADQNQDARRAEFEQQRAAEQALISSQTFDENAARQLIAGQQQRHADMMLQQMRVRHQIFQVLTPEQQKQWQDMKQARAEQRGAKGERGERRGGEPRPAMPAAGQASQ